MQSPSASEAEQLDEERVMMSPPMTDRSRDDAIRPVGQPATPRGVFHAVHPPVTMAQVEALAANELRAA